MSNKPALVKLQSTKVELAPPPVILELITNFLTNFNPAHMEYASGSFYSLASAYTDYVLSGHAEAITGIRPLMIAIKKIHNHENAKEATGTSVYSNPVCGSLHREFAKLCIKAKCYQHSLQIVHKPTIGFKKNTKPMDVVSYLYYKGLIFIGLKRYDDAIEQFRLVLSYPTMILHRVHCESYKRLFLLTLIKVAHGQIPSTQAGKHIKNLLPQDFNQILK
jgi:hypothetical protein